MNKRANLLKLSDLFRRRARTPNSGLTESFANETRKLACLVSYYYPEYKSTESINIGALNKIKDKMHDLVDLADQGGFTRIVLPFVKENPMTEGIQEQILDSSGRLFDQTLSGRFTFLSSRYDMDFRSEGPVDITRQTIFDEGIRGLADISQRVKDDFILD